MNKFKMFTYLFKVTSDQGAVKLKTTASSKAHAIKNIMIFANCPRNAIQHLSNQKIQA